MAGLLRNIPWTKQQRDVRRLAPLVARINEFERQCQRLTENELRGKTEEFRQRVRDAAEGDLAQRLAGLRESVAQAIDDRERGQVLLRIRAVYESLLDPLLPEAFAVVKNACRRLLGATVEVCGHALAWDMVPFDVQLMGGIVLHHGKIAEMATGEGKTLVATLPLYLNALTGQNVHLVTVNDYLARRDSQWMGLVFQYLGLTVGCIQNQMNHAQRKLEYSRDVTYGTASEFGFDYLRDNGLAYSPEDQVQRGYYYAIVDEVDSILIDEARTPLIISGPVPASNEEYTRLKPRVEHLVLKQQRLCGEIVQKVRDALEKKDVEAAQYGLYQLHHGMPKHKQLLHLEEDPDVRRLHEQVESMMLTDMRKEQARELREELYFTIDERGRDASLTEKGCAEMSPGDPDMYLLPDLVSAMAELDADRSLADTEKAARRLAINNGFAEKSDRIHAVDQLIRAYCLYEKDVEYVVQESQVLIVDEFTGRILPGRRWSDGLHQAIEAKEGVKIEGETQTLATITIQNYFRMYEKLAGMTGTAETEATEFRDIYKLDVVVIPTNRPVRRVDANDRVYKTQREKYKAVIEEIKDCHERGQPALVGTASVDTSEILSRMLTRARIPHNVLNAKNHEREADIVRLAGQAGTVTIATNMAGRGTDIKLGQGVVRLDRAVIESQRKLDDRGDGRTLREMLTETPCGLHVIGSERHEARRIDRQLRGRCARQGDPGSSRFYVSLEDDLMRLFGSERIAGIMTRMGLEEGQELEHRWLNRSIESAQKRVEQQNLSIRKRTLEYDDVMNRQRQIIYQIRGDVLRSLHPRETLYIFFFEDLIDRRLTAFREDKEEELGKLIAWAAEAFGLPLAQPEFLQGVLARQAAAKLGGDATPRTAEQTADALVAAGGRRESASGALEPRTGAGAAAPAGDKAFRAVTEWLKDMRVDFDGDKIRRLGTDAAQIAAVVTERISRPGGESGRELVLDGEAVRRIVTGADFAACARDELLDRLRRFYEASLPPGVPEAQVNRLQRGLMLHFIDLHWQDYLRAMDALRQGVGLRAYGQQDPLTEYKREAYQMFGNLINGIKEEVASESFRHPPWSYRGEVFVTTAAQRAVHDSVSLLGRGDAAAGSAATAGGRMVERIAENVLQEAPQSAATRHRDGPKVGRNDPCPCGSGKKHKKCCGR